MHRERKASDDMSATGVALDIKLDKVATEFILRQAKQFPHEVRRAWYYVNGIALRNMRSRMSGRSRRVPKWESFTRRFREIAKWEYAHVFGGRLMFPDGKQLTMQAEGDSVRLGWIGPLESAAITFQEGGSAETEPEWRRARYAEGFEPGEVPLVANTPPRPVVDAVYDESAPHFAEWLLGAYARVLKGKIKGWEMRYHKSASAKQGYGAAARAARASGSLYDAQIMLDRMNKGYYA